MNDFFIIMNYADQFAYLYYEYYKINTLIVLTDFDRIIEVRKHFLLFISSPITCIFLLVCLKSVPFLWINSLSMKFVLIFKIWIERYRNTYHIHPNDDLLEGYHLKLVGGRINTSRFYISKRLGDI